MAENARTQGGGCGRRYGERLAAAVERIGAAGGVGVRLDEPMAAHTSLGVGGPADVYVDVLAVQGVSATMAARHELGLPVYVIGRGTNILVTDPGIRGIVLHVGESFGRLEREGSRVIAEGGASLADVCEYAARQGLSGLEFAAGVPGAVGGAAAMNAGAGEGQMADIVERVQVVHEDGSVGECDRTELKFGYRRSCLRDRKCVAVRVTCALREADPVTIRRTMFEAVENRCKKQPLSLGSCGSVFKRPPGDYAGRLLEATGVKGLRIGGACFSTKHANFIVNEGHATAADILELIRVAKERVKQEAGVELEEEVCVLGESPRCDA